MLASHWPISLTSCPLRWSLLIPLNSTNNHHLKTLFDLSLRHRSIGSRHFLFSTIITMLFKNSILAAASILSVAQAQKNYDIDPESVPQAQRGTFEVIQAPRRSLLT